MQCVLRHGIVLLNLSGVRFARNVLPQPGLPIMHQISGFKCSYLLNFSEKSTGFYLNFSVCYLA